MTKLNAGIIVIGDEILSGRTKDINSNYIAKKLINSGIKLVETRVIQDDQRTIIKNIIEFHKKYTYVFTTGGIGPTHDDITSKSIAVAFNQRYCTHPEAYRILQEYYPIGEFNEGRQKMTKMPEQAELILNPLTAAPGFKVKNIYVLPGVPKIMQKMFLKLLDNLKKGNPIKTITINTNLYESFIATTLEKIQNENPKCSIGSYPYYNYISKVGGVNIVVSSWTLHDLNPIIIKIEEMVKLLGGKSLIV